MLVWACGTHVAYSFTSWKEIDLIVEVSLYGVENIKMILSYVINISIVVFPP